MACPDASWKKRAAKSFLVPARAVGILGTVPSRGILNGLRLLHPLMMLSRQLLTALPRSVALKKALLTQGLPWLVLVTLGGVLTLRANSLVAASPAHWSAISLPVTPAWPGTQWMEMTAPL